MWRDTCIRVVCLFESPTKCQVDITWKICKTSFLWLKTTLLWMIICLFYDWRGLFHDWRGLFYTKHSSTWSFPQGDPVCRGKHRAHTTKYGALLTKNWSLLWMSGTRLDRPMIFLRKNVYFYWKSGLVPRNMGLLWQKIDLCYESAATNWIDRLCIHSLRRESSKHNYYSLSHLGWHFRMLFQSSKLKNSNVSFHWNVAKETFELWALSFRKCHPKWDWLYIISWRVIVKAIITSK